MRTIRLALVLFTISFCADAQTPAAFVPLDVVVKDESGTLVTSLTKDSFSLLESGEIRDIRRFSAPATPWNIVLLLDHGLPWLQTNIRGSSVTYIESAWQPLVQSVGRFLGHLRPGDRVAIAAFDDQVQVLMDWRSMQAGKVQEIRLDPAFPARAGLKNFYGGIEWAIAKLQGSTGRKVVIVLTDGRDGRLSPQWFQNENHEEIFDPFFGLADLGEAEEFRRTSEAVRSSGVRFHFMAVDTNVVPDFGGRPISGLFPGAKNGIINYLSRVRLRIERLAEISGGTVTYDRADQALARYERLFDDLMLGALYTLEYTPGPPSEDLQPEMQVRLKEEKLRAVHSRLR